MTKQKKSALKELHNADHWIGVFRDHRGKEPEFWDFCDRELFGRSFEEESARIEQAIRDIVGDGQMGFADLSNKMLAIDHWTLDRVGDVQDAARAVTYTPQGLPGGDGHRLSGSNAQGNNRQAGQRPSIHIENLNLPQVRDGEDLVRHLENLMRTNGVSSGRP